MAEIEQKSLCDKLISGATAGTLNCPPAEAARLGGAAYRQPLKLSDAAMSPGVHSCQQNITVSFFFDGTGNNVDADIATFEHSNVARLYKSHFQDDPARGLYRYYLPGIGTLFQDREVNDPGGTLWGRAFGDQGKSRLNWALARLQELVHTAEQRAQNPTNKICWIKVAAFGFSRGAALARVFCRNLQSLCERNASSPTGWRTRQGCHPIEITFLGLFDTVASAGLPPSANNTWSRSRYVHAAESLIPVLRTVNLITETPELKRLAFGKPGADPAPGFMDGHTGWADDVRIGDMVTRCVHMVAAHENRNSFACDSTLFESSPARYSFQPGTTEMLYPGVHSDVGGGYRPGEGGCRREKGAQLSLVPLRAMHAAALPHVPLRSLSALEDKAQQQDFALDAEGSKQYTHMADLFAHYCDVVRRVSVPGATRGMGGQINAHMRLYYAWRFYRIRRGSATTYPKGETIADRIQVNEQRFRADRTALDRQLMLASINLGAAQEAEERLGAELQTARADGARYGWPVDSRAILEHEEALRRVEERKAEIDRLKSERSTTADDSELSRAITKFDKMLLDDAQHIVAWMKADPSLKLRPHYAALIEAYRDEYERGKGLNATADAKLIELFDDYVHDSMAGFDSDASWPSDPRIIYVGGDRKLRYAFQPPIETPATAQT